MLMPFRWTIPMRRGTTVPPRPHADETLLLASETSGWTVREDMLVARWQGSLCQTRLR